MSSEYTENTNPQHGADATPVSAMSVDHGRALRPLGPGLRRRTDGTVTLTGFESDEDFDMSSDSHSARRGYLDHERDGSRDDDDGDPDGPGHEQDLAGFDAVNRCIGCGEDLGDSNPRQYCCKTHCPLESNDYGEAPEDDVLGETSTTFDVRTRVVVCRGGSVAIDLCTEECATTKKTLEF